MSDELVRRSPGASVTFKGVSDPFTVIADDTISATVPAGAGMGKIVVKNRGGSAHSATAFKVSSSRDGPAGQGGCGACSRRSRG